MAWGLQTVDRYLVRLVPSSCLDDEVLPAEEDLQAEGWERVSARVTEDSADLVVVFRRSA
jgi:hypothetical protein